MTALAVLVPHETSHEHLLQRSGVKENDTIIIFWTRPLCTFNACAASISKRMSEMRTHPGPVSDMALHTARSHPDTVKGTVPRPPGQPARLRKASTAAPRCACFLWR